jgi:hypothetical protein
LRDRSIDELIRIVLREHPSEPALPDAAHSLEAFERASGFQLPADLRSFLLHVRTGELFETQRLLPVEEFRRTGAALQGPECIESEPAGWYAFSADVNGDCVGIDLTTSAKGWNRIFDCDHESVSSRNVIARSFS